MATKKQEAFAHQLFICGRSMKRDAEGWVWRRGRAGTGSEALGTGEMIEVSIFPSTSGNRPDFRVAIVIAGMPVFNDWKPTEERAAAWASKKLWAMFNVIGGAR